MLDESTREVTVKGLVTAIPEHLVVDVSELDMNETLQVSDLVVPEGIEIMAEPDEVLCSVLPPRKVEEEADEGEEASGRWPSPSSSARRKKRARADRPPAGRLTARHRGAVPPLVERRAPRRRPGQPRAAYEGTPHNIGYRVIEELARRHGFARAARVRRPRRRGHGRAAAPSLLLSRPRS